MTEYGMFLAKTLTVLLFVLIVLGAAVLALLRTRTVHGDHLEIKNLNQKFESMGLALKSAMLPKKDFKHALKELKSLRKQKEKAAARLGPGARKRVFVLEFKGDIRATAVASLREEITAVLTVAQPSDEVLVLLESTGGIVHNYGLAASQLARVKASGVPLTVAVDNVAASGGYMMACVADRIIAAPFAIVGSIGVVGQLPNFNRFLRSYDIDYEQFTAGEYKRTLTLFGENTDKGRQKFQEEIEDTHRLFKEFVKRSRPVVDMEQVATGEHWYGLRALDLKLVDDLRTSDDYLREQADQADLYKVACLRRKPLIDRLFSFTTDALGRRADVRAPTYERTF